MLPLNTSQIPGLFKKARALEQAGKPADAQAVYGSILKLNRDHGPTHFQLGQIFYRQNNPKQAIRHLDRAADLHPQQTAIWQLYARAVAALGDPAGAQDFLKKAKKARLDRKLLLALQDGFAKSRSKTATALRNAPPRDVKRAIDLLQAGQADKAAALAQKLRKAHPEVAIIADILANAQAAIGQPEAAEENFRAATRLDPNYAESHSNFGRFLVERGLYKDAIEQLRRALKLAPTMVRAMVHLGVALKRDYSVRKAEVVFRRALEFDPDNREARFEFGILLVNENQPEEALWHLQRAGELGADKTEIRVWIARALSALGRDTEALDLLDEARNEAPDDAEVLFTLALQYQSLARFEDARHTFRAAIAIAPKAGKFYRSFLTSEKLSAGDPLISAMEKAFADPETSDDARINFGFALAKAMEDTRQYDRVFTYLKPANDWMRKAFPFDFKALQVQAHAVMDSLRDVDFAEMDITGRSDYAPIFVTGLPRSGTTLVEQIVASHSAVTGGGELGFARSAWGEALFDAQGGVRSWAMLSGAQIAEVGHLTEEKMRARCGDAERVTDKGVQSYAMIGPIRAALPNARFVVVKRDPRDNLLSMYKNLFVDGKHLHSYNLRDLAQYFRLFEEYLAFWREKMPGAFHEIQYESLIADPETEARRLISACGLGWEDQCLSFYENKRRVDTLSVHQVRQPIYSSSMNAWKRYEADLEELLDELGGEYAIGGAD